MKFSTLRDLYVEQLKDLHSAERQIIKALPKMAKKATDPTLKEGFTQHLEETKGQLERLNKIGEALGKKLSGHTCAATKGLVEEGSEWMEEDAVPVVMDAGLIASAQRIEHYEMAGYGCARTYAKLLGETEAVGLLEATLKEEEAADKKLTVAAKTINAKANVKV